MQYQLSVLTLSVRQMPLHAFYVFGRKVPSAKTTKHTVGPRQCDCRTQHIKQHPSTGV